jgi:hypothetical protein
MRTIKESEFRTVKSIKLNKNGKQVGELVDWKGRLYYKTYREGEHYMVKYKGFGINKDILKKILSLEKEIKHIQPKLEIIIFYNGKREKVYYLADPTQFLDYLDTAENYGGKERDKDIEFYGEQWFLPIEKMKIIGMGE